MQDTTLAGFEVFTHPRRLSNRPRTRRITPAIAAEIRRRRANREVAHTIAQDFGVSIHAVYAVQHGRISPK